mmetsp:Transcript_12760/g.17158  ORF Transcript_12760/g.17158 Transcript_12760/m.17158 type:complete len:150 (-) Transcript_12760:82-531(-)
MGLGLAGWSALPAAPAWSEAYPELPREFYDDSMNLALKTKDVLFGKLNAPPTAGRRSNIVNRMADQNIQQVLRMRTAYEEKYLADAAAAKLDAKVTGHPVYAEVKKAIEKIKGVGYEVSDSKTLYDLLNDESGIIRTLQSSPVPPPATE